MEILRRIDVRQHLGARHGERFNIGGRKRLQRSIALRERLTSRRDRARRPAGTCVLRTAVDIGHAKLIVKALNDASALSQLQEDLNRGIES